MKSVPLRLNPSVRGELLVELLEQRKMAPKTWHPQTSPNTFFRQEGTPLPEEAVSRHARWFSSTALCARVASGARHLQLCIHACAQPPASTSAHCGPPSTDGAPTQTSPAHGMRAPAQVWRRYAQLPLDVASMGASHATHTRPGIRPTKELHLQALRPAYVRYYALKVRTLDGHWRSQRSGHKSGRVARC